MCRIERLVFRLVQETREPLVIKNEEVLDISEDSRLAAAQLSRLSWIMDKEEV